MSAFTTESLRTALDRGGPVSPTPPRRIPAPCSWPFRVSVRDGRAIIHRVPRGARKGSKAERGYPTEEVALL